MITIKQTFRMILSIARLIVIFITVADTSFAQGFIAFNTRDIAGGVDAPVMWLNERGPGAAGAEVYTAELFLVSLNGTQRKEVLAPNTSFRTSPAAATYYVKPITIEVPNSQAGDTALLIMRTWRSSFGSFDAAAPTSDYAVSDSFAISLGSATTPALLRGLQPMSFFVPEASPLLIVMVLGGCLFLCRRVKLL